MNANDAHAPPRNIKYVASVFKKSNRSVNPPPAFAPAPPDAVDSLPAARANAAPATPGCAYINTAMAVIAHPATSKRRRAGHEGGKPIPTLLLVTAETPSPLAKTRTPTRRRCAPGPGEPHRLAPSASARPVPARGPTA